MPSSSLFHAAAALAVSLAAAGAAHAQPAPATAPAPTTTATEHLRAGEKALADLEYELAADELTLAAVAPDATPAQRVRAHLLAGVAHRIAGREPQARLSFRSALTGDPEASIEWATTSPKVVELFDQVK